VSVKSNVVLYSALSHSKWLFDVRYAAFADAIVAVRGAKWSPHRQRSILLIAYSEFIAGGQCSTERPSSTACCVWSH